MPKAKIGRKTVLLMQDVKRFAHEWDEGDRKVAKEIAHDVINRHLEGLAKELERLTLEELVLMVEGYRAADSEPNRALVDMWLLVKYDPQRITGALSLGIPLKAITPKLVDLIKIEG